MKYTKKIYRRGKNQGQLRKTAIRRKSEDEKDVAEIEKRLKEPGPNIPWEKVKKDLGLDELIKDKKAFAKEARRQSRMLRDDPQEREILEEFDWLNADEADKMDWKC
jgi:hypothetical protein